jgi:hypothetical protein
MSGHFPFGFAAFKAAVFALPIIKGAFTDVILAGEFYAETG